MQLRQYQSDIIARAEEALERSGSAVIQIPTGGGKTAVASAFIANTDETVWFICHRQEIEKQAAEAFAAAGIDFGIVSPRHDPDPTKRVQIVSVGSMRRLKSSTAPTYAFWDECHHTPSASWSALHASLPDTKHIGLTATPERLDGKGLKDWFAELVVGPATRDLIDQGFLSPFRYFAPSDPDLRAAKLQAGDYKKGDIAKIMNRPVLIGDAVAEYLAKASGKRALVFASSVEGSKAIVERFNEEGVAAVHIDGTTPSDVRKAVVEDLAAGRIKVLSNVEVFTEGFDLPAIDAVILMRPTKSVTLFLQMVGRGLRLAEGKSEALIFDHAGLWLDHGWIDRPWEWSIEGDAKKRRLAASGDGRLRRCPSCKEVREERVEACRCGYEFPTGREIGEFDGQLVEMRNVVPEGWESRADFARRTRRGPSLVKRWLERGMPGDVRNNLVEIEAALEWVASNTLVMRSGIPDGHCGQSEFAELVGSYQGEISRLIKKGLPVNESGHIHIENAKNWYHSYKNGQLVPEGKLRAIDFAILVGRHPAVVFSWIRQGKISCDEKGRVAKDEAMAFVESRHKPRSHPTPPGVLRRKHFGKLFGKTGASVIQWVSRGLPTCGEFIPVESGTRWVQENVDLDWDSKPELGFDKKSDFARRLAYYDSKGRPYAAMISNYAKKGLPCAPNGHVHIQQGLEWVRDNTDIVIPPEAWPSANDNQQAKEEAA